ncbi:MAG: HAMP domain-containing sensor histidine kinase [bacterium]|nr:HAMP domain-containing sensor histidine kinase [bacterium]
MEVKETISQFNIPGQCKKYGLPLWQCPQFLFLIMGATIIVSILVAYIVGERYIEDPQIIVLIVLFVAAILFIMASIIIRSFEKLAEVSKMKTEFVNIVSHQLRSPVSNLKWVIEFLISGKIEKTAEKQQEYLQILKENTEKMEELISDLLIVSRIEQGEFLPKKEKISLDDLIEKAIKEAELFTQASNLKIEFKKNKELLQVNADPFQLKLAIDNLLDNAIRYSKEKGGIEIKLEEKNKTLFFEIRDNGVGIPKEDQKHIFQKFFRSGNALKHKTEGSGLGLYIVKSIIEKSGGKIGFKSQEGQGSTFWFSLPIQ